MEKVFATVLTTFSAISGGDAVVLALNVLMLPAAAGICADLTAGM